MSEEQKTHSTHPTEAVTPPSTGMSHPAKIVLGILTFWLPVYMVLFILFALAGVAFIDDSSSSEGMPLTFSALFVLHILTMLETVGLTVYYAVNVYREDALQGDRKTLWMVIVLLGGFMGQAAYYLLWIVKRSPIVGNAPEASEETLK